jgi:LmbE family N-acetylglucosaminyl deacetylase
MKKVICFAPHPDDEVLGCGGSLLKAKAKGYEISLVYLTFGEYGSSMFKPAELKEVRKNETISVCRYLQISKENIHYLDLGDNQISAGDINGMKKIMSIIRKFRPNIAYIPHENDQSYDHQQANLLIRRALGMAGSTNFIEYGKKPWWTENVLGYEVWTPIQKYQYGEDISKYINKKIEMLSLYSSQTKQSGNVSDFIGKKAKCITGYRAAMSIGEHREVFEVINVSNIL